MPIRTILAVALLVAFAGSVHAEAVGRYEIVGPGSVPGYDIPTFLMIDTVTGKSWYLALPEAHLPSGKRRIELSIRRWIPLRFVPPNSEYDKFQTHHPLVPPSN